MRDPSIFLASFMICAVSLLGSAYPLIGRFLVQSAFARYALVIAVVLFGFALVGAYSNEMTPHMAFYIAAGVAPLHPGKRGKGARLN